MTRPFIQTLNDVHKTLWKESDDGQIKGEEIKKIIKKEAGHTVVKKYFNELTDFDRIEQVPETETWIVTKPEKSGITTEHTGNKKQKAVMIPEEILKAGQQYGVNFSQITTQAVIEEISNIKQFIQDYLGEEHTEKESEYIFELYKKDLDKIQGRQKQRSIRDKRRREIYKEVFNEEKADREHISELRSQAVTLTEML